MFFFALGYILFAVFLLQIFLHTVTRRSTLLKTSDVSVSYGDAARQSSDILVGLWRQLLLVFSHLTLWFSIIFIMILGILIGLTLISIVVQGGNGEVLNETFEDVFVPFSRKVILPVSQFVAGSYRNFIPFSNVVSGIWRVFVSAFLEITVDCPIEWGDASLKLAQSSLSLLKSIFYYIISLAQEDFDLQTPISEFQDGTKQTHNKLL